jgi:hypothetical protein
MENGLFDKFSRREAAICFFMFLTLRKHNGCSHRGEARWHGAYLIGDATIQGSRLTDGTRTEYRT